MPTEENCPYFDTCVISAILKTIEVPEVLRYCAGNYANCRYLPRPEPNRSPGARREPARV
jgi:hypothetical protein